MPQSSSRARSSCRDAPRTSTTTSGCVRRISVAEALFDGARRNCNREGDDKVGIPEFDSLALASARRRKLFAALGDDVGAVVSCNTANKDYLSGYHSMTHDLAPEYMSAVVATREKAVVV